MYIIVLYLFSVHEHGNESLAFNKMLMKLILTTHLHQQRNINRNEALLALSGETLLKHILNTVKHTSLTCTLFNLSTIRSGQCCMVGEGNFKGYVRFGGPCKWHWE